MEPPSLVTQRSFVIRGRKTDAQQRAIDTFWPVFGVEFNRSLLELDTIFGRVAPRVVEIGFGNGENVIALAERHPERDFLGVEVHGAGVGRVLAAVHERQLSNVRLVRDDAVEVFAYGLTSKSLDEVLVFFPDPWPKARHRRRRLVQPDFVRLIAAALRPGGVLRLATDWEPYAEQMLKVLDAEPALVNAAGEGRFSPRPANRPVTKFERRGEMLGHAIFDVEYRSRG